MFGFFIKHFKWSWILLCLSSGLYKEDIWDSILSHKSEVIFETEVVCLFVFSFGQYGRWAQRAGSLHHVISGRNKCTRGEWQAWNYKFREKIINLTMEHWLEDAIGGRDRHGVNQVIWFLELLSWKNLPVCPLAHQDQHMRDWPFSSHKHITRVASISQLVSQSKHEDSENSNYHCGKMTIYVAQNQRKCESRISTSNNSILQR